MPHDDLMQIYLISERREPPECGGRGAQLESVAQVNLADANVVLLKVVQRTRGFFELDGEMAGVVVHAEMGIQARVVWMLVAKLVKKPHRLTGVLEIAEGFRLKAKMRFKKSSKLGNRG